VPPAFVEGKYACISKTIFRISKTIFRNNISYFENNISKYNKFVFSGRIILRMIAELLKNAPVFLKH